MRIRLVGMGGEPFMKVPENNPWNEFFEVFKQAGHEIVDSDFGAEVDVLVANHHSIEALKEADESSVPVTKRVVILWEPYIVEKTRYEPKNLQAYGIKFAPSLEWSERVEGHYFRWPQDKLKFEPINDNWNKKKKKFVLVQGNKFSARKGELYGLRRKILWKEQSNIEFFGIGWHQGLKHDLMHWVYSAINSRLSEISVRSARLAGRRYKNYLGPTNDKVEEMSKYQFSLVIENSPDYISEKLFDSVSAGCVTIYIGPKLSKYGLDENTAIEIQPNYQIIKAKMAELMNMPQAEVQKIAQRQYKALAKAFPEWENRIVLRELAAKIINDIS
jgi:hypothetical protein